MRQLAAAFLQASLLAGGTEKDCREQASGEKAAASCRTPKLPHSKAALNVPQINLELVLHLHTIDLHLHDPLVERACGPALEPTRRAPGVKRGLSHDPVMDRIPVNVTQPGKVGLRVGRLVSQYWNQTLRPAAPSQRLAWIVLRECR